MTNPSSLPPIQALNSMNEAWAEADRLQAEAARLWAEADHLWAEGDRLRAEGARLWDEGNLVVIMTAQALFGQDAQIDWTTRQVKKGR